MRSFSEEEKLPKLSEEKPSPVEERADNGGRDSHKLFAALKVSFFFEGRGGCNVKYRKQFLLKYC